MLDNNFDFEPGVEKVIILAVGPIQSELVVIDVDLSLEKFIKIGSTCKWTNL